MPALPPIAVVPMFVRCRWCAGVFRADTSWPEDVRTAYRRCAWCARLTKIPQVRPVSPTSRAGTGASRSTSSRVSSGARG